MNEKLVFVYNADSGLLNFILDAAHKIFSPSTYPCNLCALTYTLTGLPRWKRFVKNLPWPAEFLHKDELAAQYSVADAPLPAAFWWDGHTLQPWISAEEMEEFETLDEMMTAVSGRTQQLLLEKQQVG
ncbi:hypothetical protein [Candidatus Leptofilum sp.]|uniref:hypothetical protein n=1 Tax=Candidatus Leptofilum sp. TaxID=3241576 RepID=UPI003B591333